MQIVSPSPSRQPSCFSAGDVRGPVYCRVEICLEPPALHPPEQSPPLASSFSASSALWKRDTSRFPSLIYDGPPPGIATDQVFSKEVSPALAPSDRTYSRGAHNFRSPLTGRFPFSHAIELLESVDLLPYKSIYPRNQFPMPNSLVSLQGSLSILALMELCGHPFAVARPRLIVGQRDAMFRSPLHCFDFPPPPSAGNCRFRSGARVGSTPAGSHSFFLGWALYFFFVSVAMFWHSRLCRPHASSRSSLSPLHPSSAPRPRPPILHEFLFLPVLAPAPSLVDLDTVPF